MSKPVALKYCGGCDPGYVRVVVFEGIRNAAGETIEWTRFDPASSSTVLIIFCISHYNFEVCDTLSTNRIQIHRAGGHYNNW